MTKFDAKSSDQFSPNDRHHLNSSNTEKTKKQEVDETALSDQDQDDPGDK